MFAPARAFSSGGFFRARLAAHHAQPPRSENLAPFLVVFKKWPECPSPQRRVCRTDRCARAKHRDKPPGPTGRIQAVPCRPIWSSPSRYRAIGCLPRAGTAHFPLRLVSGCSGAGRFFSVGGGAFQPPPLADDSGTGFQPVAARFPQPLRPIIPACRCPIHRVPLSC